MIIFYHLPNTAANSDLDLTDGSGIEKRNTFFVMSTSDSTLTSS